jgi:hypothetical protein
MSDVKGDLSGLAKAGDAGHKLHDAFQKRVIQLGLMTLPMKLSLRVFGTFTASNAILSERPLLKWARYCCRVCSSCQRRRKAFLTSRFGSPMSKD